MQTRTSYATNKILIVDSGMQNLGGHNFSYTRAVQDALADKGFETEVFANRRLLKELADQTGYQPTFTLGAYDLPPYKGIKRDLTHMYAQSVIYGNELELALEKKLSDYAAIFCHTLADFELMGWNKFLSRADLKGHLFLLLRRTPGFSSLGPVKRTIHPYFRIKPRHLNSIQAKLKDRFTLLTDSEILTQDYSNIFKHRIVTMPIPINKYFLCEDESSRKALDKFRNRYGLKNKKGLSIGYMGDAREDKGFYLLPQLVRRVLSETSDTFFVLQCPHSASGNDYASLPKGVAEMRELEKSAGDRLILVSERLTEEDYANMFRCLDAVLVPYVSETYKEATSGIFAEAVALGKPTIVTENFWMSHELKKFGGGLEVKRDDNQDLINKVFELIKNYHLYAKKALDYSPAWREFHNSRTLAEMLLNEIKQTNATNGLYEIKRA